jgi:hypothetical protein
MSCETDVDTRRGRARDCRDDQSMIPYRWNMALVLLPHVERTVASDREYSGSVARDLGKARKRTPSLSFRGTNRRDTAGNDHTTNDLCRRAFHFGSKVRCNQRRADLVRSHVGRVDTNTTDTTIDTRDPTGDTTSRECVCLGPQLCRRSFR